MTEQDAVSALKPFAEKYESGLRTLERTAEKEGEDFVTLFALPISAMKRAYEIYKGGE